jgi:hypothetical protein
MTSWMNYSNSITNNEANGTISFISKNSIFGAVSKVILSF